MKILMYGINQDTVSKEDAIIQNFTKANKDKLLREMVNFQGVEEVALYYSSYRLEFYFHVDETIFQHGDLLRFFSESTKKPLNEVILQMYSLFNEDLVRHLFELATGYHAKERGSLKNIQYLESNLRFASVKGTDSEVLKLLFARVLVFAYQTKMMRQLAPLLTDEHLQPIKQIALAQEDWMKAKIIVMGDDVCAELFGKILATSQVRSLTWAYNPTLKQSDQVRSMQYFKSCPYVQTTTMIHLTDYAHMAYWLADADIIIDLRANGLAMSSELDEQMKAVRQTPKKQLYITPSLLTSILNSQVILQDAKELARKDYADEEVNQAEAVFDELVRHQIDEFMNEYMRITEAE